MKLYSENEPGPLSTKKPVVMENYDEIVFPEPSEDFLSRVKGHPAAVVPRLPATFNLPQRRGKRYSCPNMSGCQPYHCLSILLLPSRCT